MIDPAQIERARSTPIIEVVERRGIELRKVGAERVGGCPRCGGVDRFQVNGAKGLFLCRQCGAKGDAIALVQFLFADCTFEAAVAILAGEPAPGGSQPRVRSQVSGFGKCVEPRVRCQVSGTEWRRIWQEAVDPAGTLIETYLRSRGLELPDEIAGDVLRFHGGLYLDGKRVAGMVALLRDIRTNEPCGIHRTFLDADGRKITRKMLGRAGGAAIKLTADEDVEQCLHLAEGIETALSGMAAGYRPCWALGSAGSIAAFPVLAGIEAITILGERNDGGANERAIEKLAAQWLADDATREVFAIETKIGDDMNDLWREVTDA